MHYSRRNFLKNMAKAITFIGLPIYKLKDAIGAPSKLNIGIIASITGPLAGLGREGLRGAQLAIEEINSRGGLRGIKTQLVIMDDRGQVAEGYRGFQMLAKAYNTIALIGATTVSYDKTLSRLAESYKLPFFVINPFRSTWYRKGLKYTFRIVPEVSLMADQALSYIREIANKKGVPINKIGVFRSKSKVWDEAIGKIMNAARRERLTLSFDLTVPYDISGIKSIVQKGKNIPSDLVFLLIGNEKRTKVLVKHMREVRYNTKAIIGFFSKLGNAAYVAENGNLFIHLMDANYWGDPKRKEVQYFQKRFRNRFKVYPSNSAYGTYTAVMILKYAIENSGSIEKSRFASYMREEKFPNFLLAQRDGIKFDKQGRNLNAETILLQVSNPRPLPIYPAEYSDSKPVFPLNYLKVKT